MGIFYLSNTDIEKLGAQVFGMDPFIVLGIATFAFAGAGWLMGPFVGGAVFNLAYRGVLPEIRVVSTFNFLDTKVAR